MGTCCGAHAYDNSHRSGTTNSGTTDLAVEQLVVEQLTWEWDNWWGYMCLGSGTILMEQLTHKPFSVPLVQHLDHYSIQGIDFFISHTSFLPKLHTFRIILQAKIASNLEQKLASRTSFMDTTFLRGTDISLMLFVTLCFRISIGPITSHISKMLSTSLSQTWQS
jgi:hypothetical protein